jgi:hypothetical protein
MIARTGTLLRYPWAMQIGSAERRTLISGERRQSLAHLDATYSL